MEVTVKFEYLGVHYELTFESSVHKNEEGKLDEIFAEMLVSVVLSHIPSKKVCVRNFFITSQECLLFAKNELCYYHIGENRINK